MNNKKWHSLKKEGLPSKPGVYVFYNENKKLYFFSEAKVIQGVATWTNVLEMDHTAHWIELPLFEDSDYK